MSAHTIHASEKPLLDIFCDKFQFLIPPYQRPYSWTTEEAGELFDDLVVAMSEGEVDELPAYFLGSIVLIKNQQKPESDVVDGQQRLTTLTILLAVLRDLFEGELAERAQNYISEKGDPFAGTETRFRLQLRERDSEFFERVIQTPEGTATISDTTRTLGDAQKRIAENTLLLIDQASKLDESARVKLMTFMIQNCYLVAVEATDSESAYRVFSVMNDRGLDLSPTDILKADIIGAIPQNQRARYNDQWEGLEEDLGRDAFRDLFSHIRMIYRKAKLAGTLEAEFRRYVNPTESPSEFIDSILSPYAQAYLEVVNQAYQGTQQVDEINRRLRHLSRLDNADWEAPALLFIALYRDNPALVLDFLIALERLAFGMFIRRANINERINRYAQIVTQIEAGDGIFDTPDSPLVLTNNEISAILDQLEGPVYEIQRTRMPLMLCLDELLSDGAAEYDHKIITIEHVLLQSPTSDSEWLEWFPTEEDREYWVHRLANLVLLSRAKNSQAQNFEFSRKKQEYFSRNGVSPFSLTTQVLGYDVWTPQILQERQNELLELLRNHWRLIHSD